MVDSEKTIDELLGAAVQFHTRGQFAQAEHYYNRILALSPDHYAALNNLGRLAAQHNQHHIATELYFKAAQAKPGETSAHMNLAGMQVKTGEYRQAIVSFERVLQISPDLREAREGIALAQRELAILEDPDYAAVSGRPWKDDDSVWAEQCGHDVLFVLFSGLGVGHGKPTFIFYNFLKSCENIDKLFLRDVSLGWFMQGIPNVSDDIQTTVAFLRKQTAGYKKVVFMGCSAGGMAAILYGELVGVDKVLSFAPQTVLSGAKEQDLNDFRWSQLLEKLNQECKYKDYLDLQSLNPCQTDIDIYFSAGQALDCAHAKRIKGSRVSHYPCDGNSHVIALELRNSGQLGDIIKNAFSL